MTSLRIFLSKLRGLFRRRKLEDEMADEITAHLEMQIADHLRQGMSPEEARYLALRDSIVPRARQAIAPNLTAYAANQAPLVSVIEAAQTLWEAQRELAMARAQLGLAWARLHRTTGETP